MTSQGGSTGQTHTPPRHRSRRNLDLGLEGLVEVTRAGYDGVAEEVESIRVPRFEVPPAWVRVEGSVTRNMGNYNSIRIAVMVEMPCYPSQYDANRCYDWCSNYIENKLQNELRVAGVSE